MRTIRRYSNRKLYDLTERQYITLPRLAAVVRTGEEVQVVDHVTRADITSQTLAQVIFEEEKREPRVGVESLVAILRGGLAA
jgi:polyhydroxyalkanoate synthesis repressor PhaR